MILRNKNRERFTTVDNRIIEDGRLSGMAMALAVYLLSKPDGWIVRTTHLAALRTIDGRNRFGGRTKVQRLLKELENAGYVEYRKPRGQNGKLAGTEIVLRELSNRETEIGSIGGNGSRNNRETGIGSLGRNDKPNSRETAKPTVGDDAPLVSTDSYQSLKRGSTARPCNRTLICPSDWKPSFDLQDFVARECPEIADVDHVLAKFKNHEFPTPRSDWDAACRKWFLNEKPTKFRAGSVPALNAKQLPPAEQLLEAEANRKSLDFHTRKAELQKKALARGLEHGLSRDITLEELEAFVGSNPASTRGGAEAISR